MNKIDRLKEQLEKEKARSNLYSFILVVIMLITPILFISPKLFAFLLIATIIFVVACAFNPVHEGGDKNE